MTKCPECGFEIPDGQMYCSGCGWEVKLVPEFEPEIENRIDKTLSKLAGKIEDTEKDAPREDARKATDGKGVPAKKRAPKKQSAVLPYVLAAACVLAAVVLYFVLHKTSDDYQRLAAREAERGNGESAIAYLDRTIGKEPKNAALLLLKARYQRELENDSEGAVDTLYAIINSAAFPEEDAEEAYRRCADLYLEQNDLAALGALMEQCPFADVKNTYLEKLPEAAPAEDKSAETVTEPEPEPVPEPRVLEDSGRYTEPTKIVVTAGKDLTIRYTTDESETPDRHSRAYTEPIDMPEGESVFCFVACDKEGRCSDVVVRHYTREAERKVSAEEAVINVKQALITAGYMADLDGRVNGMEGYLAYSVDDTVSIGNDGTFYYIREIQVHPDGLQENTGRLYAVHTENGMTKRLGYDSAGKIMLMHF